MPSLEVRVIDGHFTKDLDAVGKMDPYCVVKVGSVTKKTKVQQGAGLTPKWNETLIFNEKNDILTIEAYDDDVGKDDKIGVGAYDIAGAYANPGKPATIPINILENGVLVGKVNVEVVYKP